MTPKRKPDPVRDRFDLKLDPELARMLRERAAAEDRKITTVIERALRAYLETKAKD